MRSNSTPPHSSWGTDTLMQPEPAPAKLRPLATRPLAAVAGFSFAMNLLMLAPALFMLQVFDRVLSSGSKETLVFLLLGVGAALALALGLDYLRSRLQGVVGNLVGDALLPVVARDVLARSARSPDRNNSEALRDVGTVRNLFSAQGLLAVFDAPWALVYIAVIWFAHPALGIAAACAALLMLGLALLNDWLTRRDIEALQRGASKAQRYLESSMANAEVAEAMGMGDSLLARWRQMNTRVQQLQRPTARRSVALAAFTRSTRQAVQVLILAVGAYLVITQAATPGVMVAVTILLGRALAPIEQIVASWKALAEGRAALTRLRALLAALGKQPEPMALPRPVGALEAANLILRTGRGDSLILAGVSLGLAPGKVLAVIGPSGAGKSSLIRVLAGLWAPSAGHVRLDGVDMTQVPREAMGPHLGYVPQDVELFAATVGENIARMGKVNPGRVVAAGRAAGIHDMILALPHGYDTRIEPVGGLLSPGQRQRIALARALYGEPKLLLLDEPNSNLDNAGEEALSQAIEALKGKTTIVMVTHRTNLVKHADKMLVLEAGRVKHYGPKEQVLAAMNAAASQEIKRAGPQLTNVANVAAPQAANGANGADTAGGAAHGVAAAGAAPVVPAAARGVTAAGVKASHAAASQVVAMSRGLASARPTQG
jgi:PrtD family type I secretion system ABC transporter